jgi:hypothetical protein
MHGLGHVVVAYHGCDESTRDDLIAGRTKLRPSKNPYDWLGNGVYFFEGDWRRALKFATASWDRPDEKLTRHPIIAPAVVGAVLRVGHWLDMSTQDGIDEFARTYDAMVEEGIRLKPNKSAHREDGDALLRLLDRRVFNVLHRRRAEAGETAYDAVRGAFPQGRPVAPSSKIRRDSHVQIALRNQACVLGYFRVDEAASFEVDVDLSMCAGR